MKYFYAFYLIICFVSCKAKSNLTPEKTGDVTTMLCPEDGVCTFEILENSALKNKTDHLGSIYPEIVPGNTLVAKFEYKKTNDINLQDSSYREELYIELDKSNPEIETENLKNENLFFARWCYCKGQTGFYKINKGKLKVIKISEKDYQINLSFIIDEVPQIINEINYNFSLQ
jgi:hypothetical protein